MSWSLVSSTIPVTKPSDPETPVKILNVYLSANILSGNVKITPIGLHRLVSVRHSSDRWVTIPEDIIATFSGATDYGTQSNPSEDSYIFNINLDNTFSSQINNVSSTYGASEPVKFTLTLAVSYQADGKLFWDNNNLENYEVVLSYKPSTIIASAGPSSRSIDEIVNVTSVETYTTSIPKVTETKSVLRSKLVVGSIQLFLAVLFLVSTIAFTLVTIEGHPLILGKIGAWIFALILLFTAIANVSNRSVTVTAGSEEYAPLLGGPVIIATSNSFLNLAYDLFYNRLLFPSAIQFDGAVASWTIVFIRRVWQSLSIVYFIFQIAIGIFIFAVHHTDTTTPDDKSEPEHHFTLLVGLALPAYFAGVHLILMLPYLITSILISAPWVSRQSKWISVAASSPPAYVAIALHFVISTILVAFVPQPTNHPSYSKYVLPYVLIAGPFLLSVSFLIAIAAINKQIGGLPQSGVVAPEIFNRKVNVSNFIVVNSIIVIVTVIVIDAILIF
ncbi:hypothetical protein HK096_006746 [Nowakowskiella sp. JEL0078]|nr:hypothetical protein HK096_006746 [Nowakowskiella sp. JEL0078]